MTKLDRPSCAFLALLAALTLPLSAQTIQLENGALLVGKVEGAPNDDGLTFKRLDNGGVIDLRWDQLSRQSALKLKQMLGLSVDDASEVMITADVLTFEAAGRRDSIIGRVVEETSNDFIIQRLGSRIPIPRAKIKGRSTKQVPVLEVLTEEQFYYEKLAEIDPGDDADKHVLLADFLMRVRAYDLAQKHLERAKDLGGGSQPSLLDGKMRRLLLFKGAQEERALLDEIEVARARRQFAKGLELIEEYGKRFPNGKLKTDFEATKERFGSTRERALLARVTELFYKSIRSVAEHKATESGTSLEAVRSYAETQMGKDIRAKVIAQLDLTADEVEQFWSQRLDDANQAAQRSFKYPYGEGSWILGEARIMKDTAAAQDPAGEKEKSSEEKRIEALARRIKEAQERAKRALSASGGQADTNREETPEEWWKDASAELRKVWIQAYYVENSGDLKVDAAYVNPCLMCTGDGFLRILGSSGKEQKLKCPTCHGTRFKRVVRAH